MYEREESSNGDGHSDELIMTDAERCEERNEQVTKKRKNTNEDDILLQTAKVLMNGENEKDDCSCFGNLVATKLRKLSKINKVVAMQEIHQIIFQKELAEMNCVLQSNPLDGAV